MLFRSLVIHLAKKLGNQYENILVVTYTKTLKNLIQRTFQEEKLENIEVCNVENFYKPQKKYDIIIDDIDFKYTKNDKKNGLAKARPFLYRIKLKINRYPRRCV